MAARTITHANMLLPPQKIHAGVNALTFDANSGATKFGTVSDVFLLGKIPNGATIVGGSISFGIQTNAAQTYTLLLLKNQGAGTYSIRTTLRSGTNAGSITANATSAQTYQIGGTYKVSLSDDAAIQYLTLALNCTVGPSETASVSFIGNLLYVVDRPAQGLG